MGIFDKKEEEKKAVSTPAVTQPSQTVVKADVKTKKARQIPEEFIKNFSDEEKALYAKKENELSAVELKKLIIIKNKITKYQIQKRISKINSKDKNKAKQDKKPESLGKFVFAEMYLDINPNALNEVSKKTQIKPVSKKAADSLKLLAKKYNLELDFKVIEKKEENK